MSPYGFGGTRDLAGTPCWPDFAGSGGGTASPEMVRRIAEGDRGTDDPASPRNVLTTLYGKPPFQLPAGLEDELVDAMLQMAIGDDNYPGDAMPVAELAGNRTRRARREQRDLAQVLRPVRVRVDHRPARRAVDPRRQRSDRLRHLSGRPGFPRAGRRRAGLARARTPTRRSPWSARCAPCWTATAPRAGATRSACWPGAATRRTWSSPDEFNAIVRGFLAVLTPPAGRVRTRRAARLRCAGPPRRLRRPVPRPLPRPSASGPGPGTAACTPATCCPPPPARRCRRRTAARPRAARPAPAPATSAASTSAAGTSAGTISATSCVATG